MKKILIFLLIALSFGSMQVHAVSTDDVSSYTTLREIDKGTFNEYRYRITEQFFKLRDTFDVQGTIDREAVENIATLAETGYRYLPDNLKNRNFLEALGTELRKGIQFPNNEANYTSLIQAMSDYLERVDIQSVKGSVESIPLRGNAPLTVTLRGKVNDPTGSTIPNFNYVWYLNDGGRRVEIGRGQSLVYTFTEEGNTSVFLDVVSGHKNERGFTDVLPFSSRVDIVVEEKIASVIVKVNGVNLKNNDVLKFTPAEARFGLIFDATSSTPTGGTRFTTTEWDFGNGIEREITGDPEVERVQYPAEGEYLVTLRLTTNTRATVEREFIVSIFDPIATVEASQEEGFIGDKFSFKAKPGVNEDNLSYAWEIINIDTDEVIYSKVTRSFNYTFVDKGRFNVKLIVTEPSGDIDVDTQIIYINSRAPVAAFNHTTPQANKPNTLFLDGSKSFDADFTDDGKLRYNWYIDGNKVNLDTPNANGSSGFYTFDSIGSHSVNLEVIDPDDISSLKNQEVSIKSILAVEVFAFPRVIQREGFIKFVADAPEADIFEWDFGDGTKKGGATDTITHTYNTSGTFRVTLRVTDKDGNTNTYVKTVYVGDSEVPLALIDVVKNTQEIATFEAGACSGQGAYIVDRTSNMKFDAKESINVDGNTSNIEYSWRIGNSKFSSSPSVSHKFDELGCFPVKLTIKSNTNSKTATKLIWVDVRNTQPTLTSLNVDLTNPDGDPLVVNVSAQGAEDPDGVIQSYLWYYYTDIDSEPQEFRSTTKPNTTFVLPKITGNYYFVSILKDNNEAKVNSEEVTDSKFFITVTGDNADTPLVDLSVNDSALSIGEEVIYTTATKNVLGQDLSTKVTYSWDFDGDGFYDKETSTPSVSHIFEASGTFHSKVKVKHKGISSTKTVTLNVSNVLTPEFNYISIGNKIVFFDTSKGQVDSRSWDLGDGTTKTNNNFVHTYSDNKPTHKVTLKISEGTTTKEITKTIVRDLKNIIVSRRSNLNVFTYPKAEEGIITLDKPSDIFIYSGDSNAEIASYAIDYDIHFDADLNGGEDDDEDNKGEASYLDGSITKIEFNGSREQTIRVFIKDADGNLIDSEDIKILKTYIQEQQEIDPDTIEFEGVSTVEKEKIDRLKSLFSGLEQTQRIESMSYVQRLQEEWFDDTEKTRIIIELETYLDENAPEIADESIELLESLLVEGQEDKSAKNISFNALKNLVPQSVACEHPVSFSSCYNYLISTLESIKVSESLEDNKTLGSEVLGVLEVADNMTNAQKLDFKAILKSLVYGTLDNIPEEEIEAVVNDGSEEEKSSGGAIDIISSILYWLGVFIGVFLVVAALYFIYYKVSNKDENVGFTDFIKKKTAADDISDGDDNDILSDLGGLIEESKEETDTSDVLSAIPKQKIEAPVVENKPDPKPEVKPEEVVKKDDSGVPDWLAGNFDNTSEVASEPIVESKSEPKLVAPMPSTPKAEEKTQTPTAVKSEVKPEEVVKKDDAGLPDWLAGVDELTDSVPKPEAKPAVVSELTSESIPKIEEKVEAPVEMKTKPKSEEKSEKSGASNQEKAPKKKQPKKQEKKKTKQIVPDEKLITDENIDAVTSLNDDDIPSWLKQDFSKIDGADSKKKTSSKKKGSQSSAGNNKVESTNKNPDLPDWLADSFIDDTPAKKSVDASSKSPKKQASSPKKTEVKSDKPAPKKQAKTPKVDTKKASASTDAPKKDGAELWDDGMEVPDWLKS